MSTTRPYYRCPECHHEFWRKEDINPITMPNDKSNFKAGVIGFLMGIFFTASVLTVIANWMGTP